jgi:hypothetical protein
MSEPRPHRITPEPRPDGCDVHLQGFVHQTLTDLIALLADNDVLRDDLLAIIDNPPTPPDAFTPERDLPTESLVERLAAHLPTAVRLERKTTAQLGQTLTAIARQQARTAPDALPRQTRRGEAA